jgi:hypothetical protein
MDSLLSLTLVNHTQKAHIVKFLARVCLIVFEAGEWHWAFVRAENNNIEGPCLTFRGKLESVRIESLDMGRCELGLSSPPSFIQLE